MNQKTKILFTLIMSVVVLGAGSAYLYNQFSRYASVNGFGSSSAFTPTGSTQTVLTPQVDVSQLNGHKVRANAGESLLPDIGADQLAPSSTGHAATVSRKGTSKGYLSSNYGGISVKEETGYYSSGGGGVLPAYRSGSGGSRTSSGADAVSVGSGGGSLSNITTPFAAPTTSHGQEIIIDPGGDPTGPPIPVGEGWWILLLLAAGYPALRRK